MHRYLKLGFSASCQLSARVNDLLGKLGQFIPTQITDFTVQLLDTASHLINLFSLCSICLYIMTSQTHVISTIYRILFTALPFLRDLTVLYISEQI